LPNSDKTHYATWRTIFTGMSTNESNYKWIALLITTIGAFMSPLDVSIVTIAIPSIASSINLGLEAAV